MNDLDQINNVLQREGIHKVEKYFNMRELQKIVKIVNQIYDENIEHALGPAINISSLDEKELRTYGEERAVVEKRNENFYLTRHILSKGLPFYRNLTNARSIVQPLMALPSLIDLALDEFLLDVASKYLGEEAKIGYVKVRRHFRNDLPDFDTNYFHEDDNSDKLLKAIIPLTKTASKKGGTFEYIIGSHKKKMPRDKDFRYSKNVSDVMRYYGVQSLASYTTNPGDVLFADTLGIHRGTKPTESDRIVVYVNYVAEPEYGKKTAGLFLHKDTYERLTISQKNRCEYLKVIDGLASLSRR